jgi:carbamoylphosphate synthase large subunit
MNILILSSSKFTEIYDHSYQYTVEQGFNVVGINGFRKETNKGISSYEWFNNPDPIINFVEMAQINGIVCLSTERTLYRDGLLKSKLVDKEIKVIAHSIEVVKTLSHKGLAREYFKERHFDVAPGGEFLNKDKIKLLASDIGFPIVLKEPNLSGGNGVFIIHNEKELEEFHMKQVEKNDYVLEKFIPGIECSIEVVGINETYKCLPPVYKGETNMGLHPLDKVRITPFWDSKANDIMMDIALDIAKNLAICGIIEIEIIWDPICRKAHLIEVNPRISGVTNLTNIHSEFSVEEDLVNMLIGKFAVRETHLTNKVTLEIPYKEILTLNDIDDLEKLKTVKKIIVRKRTKTEGAIIFSGLVEEVIYDLKISSVFDNAQVKDIIEKLGLPT